MSGLNDVQLEIKLLGENGEPKTLKRYWASWKYEEDKVVNLAGSERVTNLHKIRIAGRLQGRNDQSIIHLSLRWRLSRSRRVPEARQRVAWD